MSKKNKSYPKFDYEEFKELLKEELPNYFNKSYKLIISEPWVSIKSKKYNSNKHSISDLHTLYMNYCEIISINKPLELVLKDVAKTMERELKYQKTLAKLSSLQKEKIVIINQNIADICTPSGKTILLNEQPPALKNQEVDKLFHEETDSEIELE